MKIRLNQSQEQIILSEEASFGSAVNVISMKLYLPDFSPEQVKAAADSVFASVDLLSADLKKTEEGYVLIPQGRNITPCRITDPVTEEEAEDYFRIQDGRPLYLSVGETCVSQQERKGVSEFSEVLYIPEVLPLCSGGSVLYVRFHHVITDGYGMCLLAQMVLDKLENRTVVPSVFLKETGENVEEKEQSSEDAFWREYFSEADFEPSFLTGEGKGTKKLCYHRQAEQGLVHQLETYAGEQGVTVPYILCAAYAFYLAQATDKEEAVILMPRLNRRAEDRKTIGCYTLLVPVRIRIDQNWSFGELCRRVQDSARAASSHKGCGYDRILADVRGEMEVSGGLSDYVFNYYRYQLRSDTACRLELSVAGSMRNHLTWNIFRMNHGTMDFTCDLREGIYDTGKADCFTDSILMILQQGMTGDKTLAEMPSVLGAREQQKLMQIEGEQIGTDPTDTIPSLLRKAAVRFPERPAIYAGEDMLTYQELDQLSDQIAAELIKRGVKNGDSVAYMLPRDIRLIPVMFGISKTGAAFIPVDPAYPGDRIRYILENSQAAYLISTQRVSKNAGSAWLEADALMEDWREKVKTAVYHWPEIQQEQLAYMIYTSGTTGKPKGVMLSHRGIVNIVHRQNNPFNRDIVKNGTGIVAIGSVCFDISLFEIFVPLFNGLFVELGNEKAMIDAGELAGAIRRHGADILHCTPSRLAAYLGNPEFSGVIGQIEAVLSAGEMLPGALVKELKEKYGIRIYNGYGPTETTIGATITEAGDETTIGRPIMNTGLLLLNRSKRQVPYGAMGEICVYGNGVGLGYKSREEETKAKFFTWEGKTVYKTGDLGRFTEDGRLLYHGRNDRQIKLRGLRIELSEIEKVMSSCSGIKQAVCIVKKIEKSEHLAGFYVPVSPGAVSEEEMKTHMKASLTAYMVPDILKELETMPQTPGGKTDLKALAKVPVELQHVYRAPENTVQEKICLAFGDVLETDPIGIDDNFFELGGDSLRSVALLLNIEKRLGLEDGKLEYSQIYQYPTPALLADILVSGEKEVPRYPIDTLDYEGIQALLAVAPEEYPDHKNLGNVLLTGANGYLGVHILLDLLRNGSCCEKIFCLVRSNKRLTSERRIKNTLFYYGEEDFADSYGTKWIVVDGDITDLSSFQEKIKEPIDTVINSAANVAHFAYGDALTSVNISGLKNLIDFAMEKKAVLCQISTISVGGGFRKKHIEQVFTEEDFYIGQEIYNQYIYSKYMAEYAMLREAVDQGLAVKIMRVGNLQGRISDGEFQMNMKSNAFTRQLASYIRMGIVPESVYTSSVNFSPVDETAHMIAFLAGISGSQKIFHVYPPQEVAFRTIFTVLEEIGSKVKEVSDEEFDQTLSDLKRTEDGQELVEGLLTERPDQSYHYVPVIQRKTNAVLDYFGEKWKPVTDDYLRKYLTALNDMDMF